MVGSAPLRARRPADPRRGLGARRHRQPRGGSTGSPRRLAALGLLPVAGPDELLPLIAPGLKQLQRGVVPDDMTSQVHLFEAREGGTFRISLTYESPTGTGKTTAHTDTYHGHFVRLVPDKQVVEVMEDAARGESELPKQELARNGLGEAVVSIPESIAERRPTTPRWNRSVISSLCVFP